MAKIWEDKEYLDYLMSVENSKTNPKGGWVEELDLWFPHESREKDGSFTIGYGHKMFDPVETVNGQEYDLREGIPDEVARDLKRQDVMAHTLRASRKFNDYLPLGKSITWDKLPYLNRMIYSELEYNVGLAKDGKWVWKKLNKAFKDEDFDAILKETERSLDGKKLTSRNNAFKGLIKKKISTGSYNEPQREFASTGIKHIDNLLKGYNVNLPESLIQSIPKDKLLRFTLRFIEDKKKREQQTKVSFPQAMIPEAIKKMNKMDEIELQRASQGETENTKALAQSESDKPLKSVTEAPKTVENTPSTPQYFLTKDGEILRGKEGEKAEVVE